MLKIRIVSSLEKVFVDSGIEAYQTLDTLSMYKNEIASFQIAYRETDTSVPRRYWITPVFEGELAQYVTVRTVESVPVTQAVYPGSYDDNYLRTSQGLYPDLLQPVHMGGKVPVSIGISRALWIDIDTKGIASAGASNLTVKMYSSDGEIARATLNIKIIDACLPEQSMRVTQWFHCDCLADWYCVDIFSERHWEIIENFVRTAVKNGIDTLLTPVFTPPLDTAVGHERPTVQLVRVTATDSDGKREYSFDFTLLDRWIEMCDRTGIKYFEISHLFTQWGAAHAPKIMATVEKNGIVSYKQIFGWDTVVDGKKCEYALFLRRFLTELISHMKKNGNDKRCIYHISDEPGLNCIDQYAISRSTVADLLKGYLCMDALSKYEFYQQGYVTTPVVSNNTIHKFIRNGAEDLWTYYCCSQSIGASNRFIAMPGARTRFMGTQCYKYRIAGFLHWGYNFYYNQGSYDLINPFLNTSCDDFGPAGDAFSVYPSPDGTALESMRIVQFYEGLVDMRAMQLCQSLVGYDKTVETIESVCGCVTFLSCPYTSEQMLAVRRAIDSVIEDALKTSNI
ncbi:MAG: DUF4091 domain-containing protein [Clostridia bacterium]|nr:DUF4091 domain-containing protein [Clostridia bacterium]